MKIESKEKKTKKRNGNSVSCSTAILLIISIFSFYNKVIEMSKENLCLYCESKYTVAAGYRCLQRKQVVEYALLHFSTVICGLCTCDQCQDISAKD